MARTLFIGLDGATFTVLDALTEAPSPIMPELAKRMRSGIRSVLRSTPNPLTPPAWVSLMTGRMPGSHGVFDFLKSHEVGGELYTELSSATDCRCETIWSIAARQGCRVAALNFPFTAPPPRDLNGIVLPGFVPWKHLRRNTQPRDFYQKLKEMLPGFDPKALAWDFEHEEKSVQRQSEMQRQEWIDYHIARDEHWFKVASHVLAHEEAALTAVMFDGTDKLQHQTWEFLDPATDHEAAGPVHRDMRERTLRYFRNIDRYIATLSAMAGPEANVVIASDHGFTGQTGVFHANAFLHERGYLEFRSDDVIAELQLKSGFLTPVDVSRSLAYCRTPSTNGVYIRVKEHDGDGGIEPDAYQAFRDRIRTDLLAARHPVTGASIVAAVRTRDEIFAGEAMSDAPDLTLTLADHGFLSIRKADAFYTPFTRPVGTHHPDGIFVAFGPDVAEGRCLEGLSIVDVPAILLHSLGLPTPEDFEGSAPEALFRADSLERRPILRGPATQRPSHFQSREMSRDERDALMGQLAALGYAS